MHDLVRFLHDDSAATSIEYATIASGVAVAIVGAVNTLGSNVQSMWNLVSAALK
ncbi:MAG TPA: Flp family type IVb pilin [Gammaproteobacteria bacterium]|nr:Flp family type IVb pilin [Gammaproteobacteria bacterium]